MLTSVPAIYHALTRHPAFAEPDLDAVAFVSYGGAPIAASARASRSWGRFPRRGSATASASPRPPRSPPSCPTRRPPSTPTRSASRCRSATWRSTSPTPETGVGELLVRGPNVVQGYWNKPDATAETFVDGWLHTGDLGRVDEDGLLYIVDRKKDMINRGGENVYSIEVESALAGAPGVGEAAAVGVPDEMMGEKVGAVIVPAPATARVDVAAVLAHVRERLADFKVPQYVAVARRAAAAQPRRQGPEGRAAR